MGKILIIAEKPSVAKDIAAALGVPRAPNGYENADLVISNCVGHLVEINVPEAEDRTILPIIPAVFGMKPIARTKDQYKTVTALMARSDITSIVNACDAGREGEAIFRLVYDLAKCTKPMERMWLQTMTSRGILKAWEDREPGKKYDSLAHAARCRMEVDWLYGMNGSRAAYAACGRVMTPTLVMVVRAYLANTQFQGKEYWEVHGTFGLKAGQYVAKWIPQKNATTEVKDEKSDETSRFTTIAEAKAMATRCQGQDPSSIVDTSKIVKASPPLLFDLTSLQRDANRLFKFSASKTLEITQALYETHKNVSYPRTDSNCLPEDYPVKCQQVISILAKAIPFLAPHAKRIIDESLIHAGNRRIFNNEKISDHFAIIPTGSMSSTMSGDEEKIYNLICKRFLAAFHPDAEFSQTVRLTTVAGELFRVSGKVLLKAGWKAIYGSDPSDDKEPALPLLESSEKGKTIAIEVKTCKTKAPPLLTEASLLRSMETAGKTLEDEDLVDLLKERGIGTPATRAATIEKLKDTKGFKGAVKEPFIRVEKNFLVPTRKGLDLIAYLDMAYPKLCSASLTGEMEYRLAQVQKGSLARDQLMSDTRKAVLEMVTTLQAAPRQRQARAEPGVSTGIGKSPGACPLCEAELADQEVKYSCACGFTLWKSIAGHKLLVRDVKALLKDGETEQIKGFKSKKGNVFNAALVVDVKNKGVSFKFTNNNY